MSSPLLGTKHRALGTPTIVLAAGGTGGHVFPAEALAEELSRQGYSLLLITDKRFNAYGGKLAEIETRVICSGTLGRSFVGKLTAVTDIGIGFMQARGILGKLRPACVVGFGGYPSWPTMRAAISFGIPTVIHEQNSVAGRANRWLAAKVNAVATSFASTRGLEKIDQGKIIHVGNPVRSAIRALADIPYAQLQDSGTIRLLVTGGSQGAAIFSDVLPAAMATLPAHLRGRIRIDQQCREADIEVVRTAYASLNMSADLAPFFTDIPARLASAHLVVARAGASTIAELAAAGRPSILVPLPSAMDNHQYYNAHALEEAGGAWAMPQEGFTAQAVAARLEALFALTQRLSQAAANAKGFGRLHAARDLARLTLHVAAGEQVRTFDTLSAAVTR